MDHCRHETIERKETNHAGEYRSWYQCKDCGEIMKVESST